jgi:cysteinyl-tRNA synthetase
MMAMMRLFNTMSGRLENFRPLKEGKVGLYTCGPTVYDFAHIGNFRAYVFEDLLKRSLMYRGLRVFHVMNITDVDDKIIRGAAEKGTPLREFTGPYTEAFFRDIDTLNILRADVYPRATDHIPDMVKMIRTLLDKGYAYEKEGSIYFEISRFPRYGRLSGINMDERKVGVRVDVDDYAKESVHDFALWKARKPGEFFWETELGPGRPGWHIECSAMSSRYLGETFDIHCGGVDNIFPHHENEIAQSEAYSGTRFVNFWLHCQHLVRDGQKMSKSMGNTVGLQDIIEEHGVDPMAVRLMLLSTHYRKMLNFTREALQQASASLKRIRDFVLQLETGSFPEGPAHGVMKLVDESRGMFEEGLDDDLNISTSLSGVFGLIKNANILINRGKLTGSGAIKLTEAFRSWDTVLGVLPEAGDRSLPEDIGRKIQERESARKSGNFALADKIRNELLEEGIALEDTREGVRWKFIKR